MDSIDPIFLISLAGGLTVLFFGRRLFWLYIGLLGVLAGFELTRELLPGQPESVYLIVAIILGVGMALLAMALQYVAVALAGFVGGAYLALLIVELLPAMQLDQLPAWSLIIPGALGALVCLLVFNPALIVLSSLTGAAVLAQLAPLDPLLQSVILAIAAATGMIFQFIVYNGRKQKG